MSSHIEQNRFHGAPGCPGSAQANGYASGQQSQSKREEVPLDSLGPCSQSNANRNSPSSLRDGIAQHAIRSHGNEKQSYCGEYAAEQCRSAAVEQARRDAIIHRLDRIDGQIGIDLPHCVLQYRLQGLRPDASAKDDEDIEVRAVDIGIVDSTLRCVVGQARLLDAANHANHSEGVGTLARFKPWKTRWPSGFAFGQL